MMKPSFIFYLIFFTRTFPACYPLSLPYRCGDHIKNERGYISTPNFPKPYPVPINCQWVIEAPPNCRIAVYFTQFYLKTGFSASEFAHYMTDIGVGVSKSDFGVISSRDEPTYLMSNQRILVLDLQVYTLDNVHLRVTEHMLETYGFNITYEVLRKNESVRQGGCIYHHCSFTGFCLASEDLQEYRCHCVTGYFGEECQYDDDCGPTATPKVCYNGGTCRYYIGSSVRTCECPVGFEGAKCEKQSHSKTANQESDKKCEGLHSTSHPDYIAIYPGKKKCPSKGKYLYVVKASLNITVSETGINLIHALEISILKQMKFIFPEGISITTLLENGTSTEIHFVAERGNIETRQIVKERLKHLESYPFSIQTFNIDLQVNSKFQKTLDGIVSMGFILYIERMEISEKMPIAEGIPLIIACIVRGGPDTKMKWLKDGSPIVFPQNHGRLWNSTIPKNSYDSFTLLLGFDKTYVLDSGTITCIAEDETGLDQLSIPITVNQFAKPLLTPLSATLKAKDPLTITCVSQEMHRDKNVTYFWTRNDGPLLRSREQVEDLFPSGSRVIVKEATKSANYTCAIHSMSSIKKETSVINVVRDKDFASLTCHRETLYDINWRVTGIGSEDFHLCPSNYTGYIFRKCLSAENETAVWQEPDFSKCMSTSLMSIKNGFESYKMGYRIHSLHTLLKQMSLTLVETVSSLHMSEAEPFIDILSNIDPPLFLNENAEENWKIIINTTSLLLNTTSVTRKQSKQKMYNLIRNISLSYGKDYMDNNSSKEFVSPTLIVKVWKIPRDFHDPLLFPEELHSSWNSSIELMLKVYNFSEFEGNSSVTVVMILYKSHTFAGIEEFPSNYSVLPHKYDFVPFILTEAKGGTCDDNIPIKVLLTYKHIVRAKRKIENFSCYKMPVIERSLNIQSCEKVEKSGEDIICQCLSSGLLSVVLLEKQIKLAKEKHLSIMFKILPIFGIVISIAFLLYTFGILGYKTKITFQSRKAWKM